jgi:hypothetical protein
MNPSTTFRVSVCAAASALLLCSVRLSHADEPHSYTDLALSAGGFTMGIAEPAASTRCTALGSTLRQGSNHMLHCELAAASGRPAVRISLGSFPGRETVGNIHVIGSFANVVDALTAFDEVRPLLAARFGSHAEEAVPEECSAPEARTACLTNESFQSITATWTVAPPSERPRPNAAHPELATLEQVTLEARRASDRNDWSVSVTRMARGYLQAVASQQ